MNEAMYTYHIQASQVHIALNDKPFLTLPASASVNDRISQLVLAEETTEKAVFTSSNEKMVFEFKPDSVLVTNSITFAEDTPIFVSKMFKSADAGIELANFDRVFTSQPRNNGWKNMDYFNHLPDISLNG